MADVFNIITKFLVLGFGTLQSPSPFDAHVPVSLAEHVIDRREQEGEVVNLVGSVIDFEKEKGCER